MVEVGEFGVVWLLNGWLFVVGLYCNVYYGVMLVWLVGLGVVCVVMLLEMSQVILVELMCEKFVELVIEVMVWGCLLLVFFVCCFMVWYFCFNKDDCGFCCIEYFDGLVVCMCEGQEFFVINGIQM